MTGFRANSAAGADDALLRLARGIVERAGLELVDVALRRSGRTQVLRLDIDRAGVPGVSLDECQRVSRALGQALDESDAFPSQYRLEVSSPGADRPIRTDDDIRRNTGRRVVVIAASCEGARETLRGVLRGADGDFLLVQSDAGGELRIPRERVVRAQQELAF